MEKLPVLVRGHDHKTIAFDDEVVHDPGSFEEVYIRLIADMARVARYAEALAPIGTLWNFDTAHMKLSLS